MNMQHQVPLQLFNTLSLSCHAKHFVRVTSTDELIEALRWANLQGLSPVILGGGSNIVFRGDVDGLVIKLDIRGKDITRESDNTVHVKVAAGEPWHAFVCDMISRGWYGLENLSLIPGTVGASPIQNIGAYGVEVKSLIESVEGVMTQSLERKMIDHEHCEFGYRDSVFKRSLQGKFVVTAVNFKLSKAPVFNVAYEALHNVLEKTGGELTAEKISQAVCKIRREKLPDPDQCPNVGSFFKNPVVSAQCFQRLQSRFPDIVGYRQADNQYKLAAGWVIDRLGWKGRRFGSVGVHPKQALVLVNYDKGTANDVLLLAQKIRQDVAAHFGISLEIEPVVI